MNHTGTHLILDFFGAHDLDNIDRVHDALVDASDAIGATILEVHTHKFEPQGVTGVVLLAESHMSIHTWPETQYAAIDIFVCSKLDPQKAIDVLKEILKPTSVQCMEIKRGMM